MIDPAILFKELERNKVNFYSGVPDSLLKYFCSYVADFSQPNNHIIAANEGAALSIGIGYHLATKQIPLIYMQNSGLGNAINPLTSLTDPDVYSIPVILMIGWRGEPGKKDEPQHVKQGAVTTKILEALDIPYQILSESIDHEEIKTIIKHLCQQAKENNQPVALVVKKGTFSSYKLQNKNVFDRPFFREQALEVIISELSTDNIFVSTTGMLSRELFEIRESKKQGHRRDFLTVGGMGHASQIALGIALQKKEQIFCLDGDGSMIMHMGSLAINAKSEARNFKHILFNNSAHDSVGGQPTIAGQIDLDRIIKGLGYKWFKSVQHEEDIRTAIKEIEIIDGPAFLEIQIKRGHRDNLGRPTIGPIENKLGFMGFIGNDK